MRLLLKALWPRKAVQGASGKADVGFFFLNTFSAGGLIGRGLLSQVQVIGCNLGSALAIWDFLFGALYVPQARREPLRFGVAGATAAAHTVTGSLVTPMFEAGKVLLPSRAGAEREELLLAS